MSLIVAKKEGDYIYIVSDTKLTNTDNLNREKLPGPEEFSAIKTVILNPWICISFAGYTGDANKAIAECRKMSNRVNDIIKRLLEVNINSNNCTEFIVCVNIPPFLIFEIKGSKCETTSSAWIGSNDGFNEFQKIFLSSEKDDLLSKMEDGLSAVIESYVKGVNGFMIAVTNKAQHFAYQQSMKTYMPARTYTGNHVLDVYGLVQEGGYTLNIFTNDRNDVLAVHIRQNKYGLIYTSKNGGYLEPEIFRDVDEHEFNEITEQRHNMKPLFIMSSQQKSYLERGNRAFLNNDFNKAIKFYNLGLAVDEIALKANLHFQKGLCLFSLSKFNEGANTFYEAVKIDRSYQPLVLQYLSQFMRK
jgi:hypothetical protein